MVYRNGSIIYFREVQGELLDLGVVELPQVGQELGVSSCHEVDSYSFSSETTRSADPVDVLGGIGGKIVVDDEVHLLDVDTSAQQVSGNEDSGGSTSELSHDVDSFSHVHIS